jgi:hypothetical protein
MNTKKIALAAAKKVAIETYRSIVKQAAWPWEQAKTLQPKIGPATQQAQQQVQTFQQAKQQAQQQKAQQELNAERASDKKRNIDNDHIKQILDQGFVNTPENQRFVETIQRNDAISKNTSFKKYNRYMDTAGVYWDIYTPGGRLVAPAYKCNPGMNSTGAIETYRSIVKQASIWAKKIEEIDNRIHKLRQLNLEDEAEWKRHDKMEGYLEKDSIAIQAAAHNKKLLMESITNRRVKIHGLRGLRAHYEEMMSQEGQKPEIPTDLEEWDL